MAVPILLCPAAAAAEARTDDAVATLATTPFTTSVLNDGVFWMSLSSDERYLLPKLDALMDELKYKYSSATEIQSFRISNTQDISNLTSNKPLHKLKQVFDLLSKRTQQHHRVELFIKMSLQTESFQDLLKSALESGAFSRLVIKGDYWTVAMEPRTMECIANALQTNRLRQFQLVGMYMPTPATRILAQSCQDGMDCHPLGVVLQFCRIHFEDTAPLFEALGDNALPVKCLSMVECHWDDTKLVPLMRALTRRLDDRNDGIRLTRLSLAGNALDVATLQALANYLEHPRCMLQHLNLSRQTTPDLAEHLCCGQNGDNHFLAALANNQSLRGLHLTDLCLQGRHLQSILDQINSSNSRSDNCIEELNLANNQVNSISQVWYGFPKQPRNIFLKRLDLSGNPFWSSTSSADNCQRDVLMQMTHAFPHLSFVGQEVGQGEAAATTTASKAFWTQLQYSLDMNCAGRCLYTAPTSPESLPLALVPLILERANNVLTASKDYTNKHVLDMETDKALPAQFTSSACQNNFSTSSTLKVTSRSASAVYGMIRGLTAEHMGGGL